MIFTNIFNFISDVLNKNNLNIESTYCHGDLSLSNVIFKENKIYFEVSGKKDGIPVFFVHGGPGGHCRSEHHSLFNPEIFKSVKKKYPNTYR